MADKKLPMSRALTLIFLWTLMVSGSTTLALLYYQQWHQSREQNPRFLIKKIRHQGDLPTSYLAELMELSQDDPVNLYQFSTARAQSLLEASSLIQWARVSSQSPDTVEARYCLEEPVAILGNWTGTLLSREGRFLPAVDVWNWKTLPVAHLTTIDAEPVWGELCQDPAWPLVLEALEFCQNPQLGEELEDIDVSQVLAESCGREELVLRFKRYKTLLRCHPRRLAQALGNFSALKEKVAPEDLEVVDLRLDRVGLLTLRGEHSQEGTSSSSAMATGS